MRDFTQKSCRHRESLERYRDRRLRSSRRARPFRALGRISGCHVHRRVSGLLRGTRPPRHIEAPPLFSGGASISTTSVYRLLRRTLCHSFTNEVDRDDNQRQDAHCDQLLAGLGVPCHQAGNQHQRRDNEAR
ncbi:Uncharacterised protein [Chlamydia trachomatis]|nr:Uncharacterised protein [Chlamydia trachomatis]